MGSLNHLPQSNRVSNADSMIEEVKDESYRWRSLDIAFCAMPRVVQTLEFLGETRGSTLHLESLTIGPMGSATLVPNMTSLVGDEITDTMAARLYFQKLNVTCKVLRIDAYPLCPSPIVFSPRLTTLEVIGNYTADFEGWAQILSQIPSLTHLRLVSFLHWHVGIFELPGALSHPEIKLLALEKLELAGHFVLLAGLLARSSLPKLEYLLLNLHSELISVASQLASIALVSPSIRQLSISALISVWDLSFRRLRLLQEITFCEMGWRCVMAALATIGQLPSLSRIRLERIWDIDMRELDNLMTASPLLPIELIDCHNGSAESRESEGRSEDGSEGRSEGGSNFSSNSSFSPPHTFGYPSSEETDSDESERSYGEDEDNITKESAPS